ncbi:MarR family transcriptional regulator [Bremerella sp. JC817]|uniref:MarR family winged helix-turn-helix transcriptional regulator n=1 Tax=Bremerella sp. JC817 TaxID=3231756 RepID=UPI00345ADAEA
MQYDFHASTGYWVCLAAQHFQQRIDAELRPFGITFRQFQVIAWLKVDGPLTQSELARRMFIEKPTLSGIMNRMEAMDWIRRASCVQDRRKKHLEIGSAAEPVWEKICAILTHVREQAVQGLSAEEVSQLHSLLGRVQANLDGLPAPSPFPQTFTTSSPS